MMIPLENLQFFGEIRQFVMLTDMCGFWMNQLCVLVWFLKTLKVLVIATMAPVSRFELIGDEYLDVAPECREVIRRVGWLGFLQKFSGHNVETSKVFAALFDGYTAQVGDVELRLT